MTQDNHSSFCTLFLCINLPLCFSLILSFRHVPLFLCFRSFFVIHCQALDAAVRAPLRELAILPSPAAQGVHLSGSAAEQSHSLLQETSCVSQEGKWFPAPLGSPRHPVFPISWAHGVSRKIWTVILTLALAEDFYTQQGNQPSACSSCACPGSKAWTQTHCRNHISPLSLCTSLGQSKAPAELWGCLKVEELNTCCELAREQGLMDAVWLHPSHNGRGHQLRDEHGVDNSNQEYPCKPGHVSPTVGTFGLCRGYFLHFAAVLYRIAEVLIYKKLLHRLHLLEPGWSPLCSDMNILLYSPTAVSDLS